VQQEVLGEVGGSLRPIVEHMSIASSSTANATRGCVAVGLAVAHAASSAAMIGESGMRVSADGVCGDWPCLAERMMTVLRSRPRTLSTFSMSRISVLM
jgi:hypothetical protein